LFAAKSGKNVVMVEYRSTPRWSNFYEGYIMDNQKPNEGSARDTGREGSGTSMGKDQLTGRSEAKGSTAGTGPSGTASVSGAGNMSAMGGSTTGSSGSAAAGSMGDTVAKGTQEMHKTIDKAAEAAQPVVDRLASTAHAGVDKMSGMLSGASQSMSERSKQVSEAYRNLADSGREYVRTSPGTAVMVALGAGFILAKLLGRRD
jgi:ElaB/YqjD/DUF883 family membrane-anchored ribosome-binding protein